METSNENLQMHQVQSHMGSPRRESYSLSQMLQRQLEYLAKTPVTVADIPEKSGGYALYHDGVCVYVGQSKKLRSRLTSHWYSKRLFNCIRYWRTPADNLINLEALLIEVLVPKLNVKRYQPIRETITESDREDGPRWHIFEDCTMCSAKAQLSCVRKLSKGYGTYPLLRAHMGRPIREGFQRYIYGENFPRFQAARVRPFQ